MATLLGNIGAFDEATEQWSAYTERFEYFCLANKIADDVKVPTFLSVMGGKAFNLLRSLSHPHKPGTKTYVQIVKILGDHYSPKPLIIAERFRFHKRNQEEGESVAQFVAALKGLSEHCEFGGSLDDTIRDRLVCGLRSESIQKRLLTEAKLTLAKAVELSTSMEMATRDAQQLSAGTQVHKLSSESTTKTSDRPCYRCGKTGHEAQECWCRELDCRHCGKTGHIERVCRNKNRAEKQHTEVKKSGFRRNKKKYVNKLEHNQHGSSGNESDDETVCVLSIRDNDDGYWVTPLLENSCVRMQIDTGSRLSMVSEAIYREKLKHLTLQPTKLRLRTYTGEAVPVLGFVKATVEYNEQKRALPLYVIAGNRPALFGRSWLEELKLNWQEVFLVDDGTTGSLREVLEKHTNVFGDELGSMKDITVKLTIKPGSTPKCLKARPVPYAIKPKVEAELDRLVESGVLEQVRTSEWATPIVPVVKKDGSLRICGDFKVTVNPVLAAEQYPLPLIDDIFAGLAGGQKFSKIDLCQAYLQMHVVPESQELLTIVTHKGLYRYKRLPFGITSAPALFQRAMEQILSGLPGVQCYLDDLLITGTDEKTHLRNLEATLQRLEDYGLRVRKDKCEFFRSSVEYLGHVIDSAGLHKAPSKVKAVMEAPSPVNVTQLRSFLGLLTYYGKFVPNLANQLKPLHELLNKAKQWEWTKTCETAFKDAKRALCDSGALIHFDPALPIQLACDASPYGVGAVVSHILPSGEERPIAFASRTLSQAEGGYAQIEREALAIVFGVKRFHQYLFGRKFTLLTDHRPLTSIFGPHSGIPSLAASRMQRWALLLSAHQYDIKYRKADLHGNADGLSRLPLSVTHTEPKPAEIFYFKDVTSTPVTSAHVKKHTRADPVLSEVVDIITRGKRGVMTQSLKPYLERRNELSVQAGCLLWGYRVIIPPPLRGKVLNELHSGHCGVVRMKEIARSYFWWPGLDVAIEEKAKACHDCLKVRNHPQLAPLHPWAWPEEPWQRIHIDFAGPLEGSMFLVVVDAHSKWPEVVVMKSTSTEKTIEELRSIFSRFGLPQQLVSDNGPQLVSEEFKAFMEENGIHHIKSAPYHPATNGLAERFVQTMKQALKSSQNTRSLNQRLSAFLLSYRNTPHATTKVSPASALLKRQLRTRLDLLRPLSTREVVHSQQRAQVDRRAKARLRTLTAGDHVLARNYARGDKWKPATVLAKTGPVSYTVETSDHLVWRRHIDQLLHASGSSDDPNAPAPSVPDLGIYPDQHLEEPQIPPVDGEASPPTVGPEQVMPPPPSAETSGIPAGRTYPKRDRRPPDKLSL